MHRQSDAARRQPGGTGQSGAGSNRLYTHDSTDKRRAQPRYGIVAGDVWRKTANATKHMLRAPRAWAVDTADLASVESLGVRYVQIHDLEQMRSYWARPETLRAKGFVFERGFGEQVALSLEWWRSTPAEADAVAEGLQESEPEPVARQGALF